MKTEASFFGAMAKKESSIRKGGGSDVVAGLDFHKRYSQVEVVDEGGLRRAAARLPNEFEQVEEFFRSLGEPCPVVLEAGWNWGLMYDWLEQTGSVSEVQLAHPYGVRAIAAAQVKTDRIDVRTLAQLLRAGLIPRAYIPGQSERVAKFNQLLRIERQLGAQVRFAGKTAFQRQESEPIMAEGA